MDYKRIICFGDNCELGFVLNQLGHNSGQLFKWTSQKIEDILNVLNNDFLNFFEFENLIPCYGGIKDTATNVWFHSKLCSTSDENKKAVFEEEKSKINYLIANFKERAFDSKAKNIFVSKSFTGFDSNVYNYAVEVIKNYFRHDNFKILFITENPSISNFKVNIVSPHIILGELRSFADHRYADQYDFESWKGLLDAALISE